MGKTGEITTGFTGYTYQTMDFGKNSNYTGAGLYCQGKFSENLSWKGYAGLATAFEDGNNLDVVLRAHGKYNYNKYLNQNIRLQGTGGDNKGSFQVRYSPVSVDIPINKNLEAYGNLYYKGQYNSSENGNGKPWKNSLGAFAGVTYTHNDVEYSIEAERYNLDKLSDNSAKNWGINATVNIKF